MDYNKYRVKGGKIMKESKRVVIVIVMIISLLASQAVYINLAIAEEITDEQAIEEVREESSSDIVETEETEEETSVEETTAIIPTTIENMSETKPEENSDNNIENFVIVSDNLPDYVDILVEKQEIKPFQTVLDNYYAEQENLIEDDLDDEEGDNEDNEGYIDGEILHDRFFGDIVMAAYKITFINTNDGTEYKLPEGESVKIKVNNKAYDKAYASGVMNLKEDNSFEMIEYQRFSQDWEESTYNEYDDIEQYDEEEEDIEEAEEDEDIEDDDSIIENYEYNEEIEFEVVGGERYAILSGVLISKSSDDIIEESANGKKAMISPKTGIDNRWYTTGMLSIILLGASAYNYKKKKIAKVHKTN